MDKRALRWVSQELPKLVGEGVVPAETAERIRRYYDEVHADRSTERRWAIVLFGILGTLLIGGGVILLLAHNWEELSRPLRAAISVSPLAVSAGLGGWLLWSERPSAAWREGVGTIQTLAIGSSIALVAQTYNLGGRFDEFMLTWSLLALPIAYLLRATLPALLYLIGITVWTGSVANYGGQALWYFVLLVLALPFLWWTGRENRLHPRPVWFAWTLAITACIGSGLALENACSKLVMWPVLFGGLFSMLYLVGSRWWGDAQAIWQRPFQSVGILTTVGLSLVLSFTDPWDEAHWRRFQNGMDFLLAVESAMAIVFPIAAMILWVESWRQKVWHEVMIGAVAALATVGWILTMQDASALSAALFNLYMLTLGIGTLVIGLRNHRLGVVNAGMLVLAAMILCRFFDADLGFVLRGVAFILVGVGFLIANMVLLRGKGAVKR